MARYTTELRAEALAELLAGNTEPFVAQKFGVPRRTLGRWRAQIVQAVTTQAAPAISIESLVGEVFALLHCNLRALRAMDELAQDPKWLRKQDAHQIALLYGVMADKTHRWLGALQAGNGDAA